MSQQKMLSVVEQREINFYDDQILVVKVEDGTVYVPIRPICEQLGVDWSGQAKKLNSDPVLSEVSMSVELTLQTSPGSRRPKTSRMLCLPLDYVNGWIFGINVNRVKEEIRAKLMQYQRDVYRVLFEAFGRNEVTAASDPRIEALLAGESLSAIAYRQAMAIANIARQQVVIEARLESAETHLFDHENRIQILEANQGDDSRYITNAQAVQVAQGVKQIALVLSRNSGQNAFGGVYGELHRRFEIPSYQQLPKAQFAEAMHFLRDWWQALTDSDTVPFLRPAWSEIASVIAGGHEQDPITASDFPAN